MNSRSPLNILFGLLAGVLAQVALTVPTPALAQAGLPGPVSNSSFAVLASNDLGMHCTDQDFQIFSILPPFNVVHAQVIRKGVNGAPPSLIGGTGADVYYAAASNTNDPAGAGSINTGNASGVFKTNFWLPAGIVDGTAQTFGSKSYRGLYPVFRGKFECARPVLADGQRRRPAGARPQRSARTGSVPAVHAVHR